VVSSLKISSNRMCKIPSPLGALGYAWGGGFGGHGGWGYGMGPSGYGGGGYG
jgi:hypothetical protein